MKRKLTRAKKESILREANFVCLYCGNPANEVDHIYPHSYSLDDKEENLAASCNICNQIAGNKVFNDFIEKQTYILEERKKSHWKKPIAEYRSMCQEAGLPLPIERHPDEKPKKEKKKVIRTGDHKMKRPKLPSPWKPTPRKERKPVEPPPRPEKFDWYAYFGIKPKIEYKWPQGVWYNTLEGWKILFQVKYEKEGTYQNVAAQYGLKPETVRLIAEGHDPGNEVREMLLNYKIEK